MTRRRPDDGSATVWVLLAATVLWSVATWGLALASTAAGRARASSAADLSALAAARDVVLGDARACTSAARVAQANGGLVRACTVDPAARTVEVVVEVRRRGPLGRGAPALARARAGPG